MNNYFKSLCVREQSYNSVSNDIDYNNTNNFYSMLLKKKKSSLSDI